MTWSLQKRNEQPELLEQALVDTIALTPSTGLVIDPYPPDPESFLSGIFQAGPLAVGGLLANGLNIVATVVVARLLTTNQYGGVAQLLGLFFVLSMPGSALLVGVVRRITAMASAGQDVEARAWTTRLYRRALAGVAVWTVVSIAVEDPISHALRLPDDGAVALTMIAAGFWMLLSLDRAILQSHRRYAGLGLSLIVEIGVRTVLVLIFAELGWGIWGYVLGLMIGEAVAVVQVRVAGRNAWRHAARTALPSDQSTHSRCPFARSRGGAGRLRPSRSAAERRHHLGGTAAALACRFVRRHFGGLQSTRLRGHPVGELHPARGVDPLASG